ncbi:MAG: FkbM family methyltransferase [Bacteroidales bacterium]|nr:FkbM family methyltransferase [Bacteroidales bacterium]
MKKLVRILRVLLPTKLLDFYAAIFESSDSKSRRNLLIKHLQTQKSSVLPLEIKESIKYLKWHKYSALPYKWANKYDHLNIDVRIDLENGFYYVIYQGKKMYYPKRFSKDQVIWSHRNVLKEQDINSPHRYLTDSFVFPNNSIVIDAGVAEGNFALSIVEQANKVFLIEPNKEWIEALKLTFKPWDEKIFFIEKFLSNQSDMNCISLPDILSEVIADSVFIKMDIEGFEIKALSGVNLLINRFKEIRITVCTYHHEDDLGEISNFFHVNDIPFEISDGYIFFYVEDGLPSFRKAVIRAQYKLF